ncbi:DUF1194 domain-containing protein [Phyllobacterium salinisoli]|uniref:DUF1194 domain-containing protein n=2 Tax=Phyllobacterium salinisoli TaxID=1899321 RepID=A0A368K941_9HYPH|nr:DUF1194 domain-containing protein [Phyllobacterium salinisoli]
MAVMASFPARAQDKAGDGIPVDVELVLAVDASRSMEAFEQKIQRDGYVAALRHPQVIKAILEGLHGRVAITYIEWAGFGSQRIIVPWTLVDSKEAAEKLAAELDQPVPPPQSRTSISGAIDFSAGLFDNSGFKGQRRIIDVSGDGPNNHGRSVTAARAAALDKGITINGLPLMTRGSLYGGWDVKDLDQYYGDCVIGGPGAFMIPVNSWEQFPEAVRRKLMLELAGDPAETFDADDPPVLKVQEKQDYDCMAGERVWQQRMRDWEWR